MQGFHPEMKLNVYFITEARTLMVQKRATEVGLFFGVITFDSTKANFT